MLVAAAVAAAFGAFSSSTSSASGSPAKTEGIKVHGAWTIAVRSHGRTVAMRRFENSLTAQGGVVLAKLLAGIYSAGPWFVSLSGGPQPCAIGGSGTACEIWTQNPPAQPNRFTTLVVTLPTPGVIHLQGTATAGQDGSIDQVSTQLLPCQGPVDQRTNTAPANCDYGLSFFPGSFTSHAVSPGIPVTSGQQVLVKVDISFS